MTTITFDEWRSRAISLSQRAERLRDSIREEARRTAQAAGLDPNLLGIHPHNAMCAFEAGKPWPGVDYALVRKTLWLLEKQFEPTRLAERVSRRLWARISNGGGR